MRIAFFGGSFDPPHAGHLAIAQAAQRALALDTVLFAPVALQPFKPAGSSASFDDRAAMTRLAIAGQPHCQLSLIDAPIPGSTEPNYTIHSLLRLRPTLPPAAQLYLLLGSDSFATLPKWHRAAEIPFLASLIVASRPGDPFAADSNRAIPSQAIAACLPAGITLKAAAPDPAANDTRQYHLAGPSGRQATLHVLPGLHYDISATRLRQAIRANTAASANTIPAPVLAYIRNHHLYR